MMREIVPAATARVTVAGEAAGPYAGREVTRRDRAARTPGRRWPASTARSSSGCRCRAPPATRAATSPTRCCARSRPSRGPPCRRVRCPSPGRACRTCSTPSAPFEVVLHEGFGFWIEGVADVDAETRASMERANARVIPTARLSRWRAPTGLGCATGATCDGRCPEPEEALLDGAGPPARGRAGSRSGRARATSARSAPTVCWSRSGTCRTRPRPTRSKGPATGFRARLDQALALTDPVVRRRAPRAQRSAEPAADAALRPGVLTPGQQR